MPISFPGMDPWLERPSLWPDVHDSLIMALRIALAPLVSPRYYIAIRQRTVFAVTPSEPAFILPDVSVIEQSVLADGDVKLAQTVLAEPVIVDVPVREKIPEDYLEVVEASTHRVIAVIEILSLSNKMPGKDRRVYEIKRERIFQTPTHLVEIDLLRGGEPMPFTLRTPTNGHLSHYRILVKRGDYGRRAHLYPFNVRDLIPIFPLPLLPGDAEPPVRLGDVLKETYNACRYGLRIDYAQPPEPPLSEVDAQWAQGVLRAAKAANS
jgi:hypothetical protein